MKVRSFAHRGLSRLYNTGNTQGVAPETVDKLRKMLAFLDAMEDPKELRALTTWKPHVLGGNRRGTWSLAVTANYRLTFRIAKAAQPEIIELNLEDYH